MIKKLWSNKDVRVLCFSIFNAIVAFLGTLLIAPEFAPYSPILVPILNIITKMVNTKVFGDIGVEKPTV